MSLTSPREAPAHISATAGGLQLSAMPSYRWPS